jgi:hypothetical protein
MKKSTGKEKGDEVTPIIKKTRNLKARMMNL